MKVFIPAGILLVLSAAYVMVMQPKASSTVSKNSSTPTSQPTASTDSLASAKTVDTFSTQLETDLTKDMDSDLEMLTTDDSKDYDSTVGAEEF